MEEYFGENPFLKVRPRAYYPDYIVVGHAPGRLLGSKKSPIKSPAFRGREVSKTHNAPLSLQNQYGLCIQWEWVGKQQSHPVRLFVDLAKYYGWIKTLGN